jgi:hypothetical protein
MLNIVIERNYSIITLQPKQLSLEILQPLKLTQLFQASEGVVSGKTK